MFFTNVDSDWRTMSLTDEDSKGLKELCSLPMEISPVLKQFFFRNIYREGYYGVPDDQKSLS